MSDYVSKHTGAEIDAAVDTVLNGDAGADAVSPTATVEQTENGATITITDKNGTTTATITNGVDGQDGQDGQDGYTPVKGVDYFDGADGQDGKDGNDGVGVSNIYQKTISVVDGGENVYVVELTDGTISNFKVRNGNKGADGAAGADGNGIKSAVLNADYTLTLTFDDGTSYTTTSIRGAAGATGSDGKDGAAGADGKDGTSVTVKSVSESSADGGSNVVTFSDGKTLTVKNGSKGSTGAAGKDGSQGADGVGIKSVVQTTTSSADGGSNVVTVTKTDGTTSTFTVKNGSKGSTGAAGKDGAKGDKGDSYVLTAADKQEIAGIVPIVKVAETPKIVDSVDDMTDTTKHYVRDGYIWHHKTVVVPGETTTTYPNQLVASTAELNKRYSISSASTSTKNGYFFTDYIAATGYASVTPYNVRLNWEMPFSTATDVKAIFFDASKAKIGATMLLAANTTVANGETVIDLKTISGSNSAAPTASQVAYVRLQLATNSSLAALTTSDLANLKITFDAIYETESTESVTTQEWVNSGIPYAPTFQTDLIGVLGEGNVVYLSDNLPAGTYTLKYGDEYAVVGTITVQ